MFSVLIRYALVFTFFVFFTKSGSQFLKTAHVPIVPLFLICSIICAGDSSCELYEYLYALNVRSLYLLSLLSFIINICVRTHTDKVTHCIVSRPAVLDTRFYLSCPK